MENERLLSNIRELCKKEGISITNLEKKHEFGAGTISRWNKASPSIDKLEAIAKYFNVTIDSLVGYQVNKESVKDIGIDEKTQAIVNYLIQNTKEMESNKFFWHDYFQEKENLRFKIENVLETKSFEKRIFISYDEDGYYLFKASYYLNENYDYETQLQLYLIPDEETPPVLECDDKLTLQPLYINIMHSMETEQQRKINQEKVERQRENILKKIQKMNV